MMNKQTFQWLMLSSLGLIGVSLLGGWIGGTGAIAQTPADPDAEALTLADQAQLSAEQIETLEEFAHPVAVPTYVPDGFEVAEVEVWVPDVVAPVRFEASYRIVYQQSLEADATPACFEIEGALGGFGGPIPPYQVDATLPTFAQVPADYTYQLFWSDGTDAVGPFPVPLLFSDWIEGESAFYRVSSWATEANGCDRIAPTTANQILESLQYLP